MRGDAAQRDGQKDDCGNPQTEDKSKQHIFTPASFYPIARRLISGRRVFILTAPLVFFLIFDIFDFEKFNFEHLPS